MTGAEITQEIMNRLPAMISYGIDLMGEFNDEGDYKGRDRWAEITNAATRLEVALYREGYCCENNAQ